MRLTTKGRYAVTAMIDLAVHQPDGPVTLKSISENQGISLSYLEQLFAMLRRNNLVVGARGPGGGYVLARDVDLISMADIVVAVDERLDITKCDGRQDCHDGKRCLSHDLWSELSDQLYSFLHGIRLGELMRRSGLAPGSLGKITRNNARHVPLAEPGPTFKSKLKPETTNRKFPMTTTEKDLATLVQREYKEGFVTEIDADTLPPGLDEDVIRTISAKKGEPEFMLEWRLDAYRRWLTMPQPKWAQVHYPPIDYQAISYYSAPQQKELLDSLDEVDPKLLETYQKLGIPIDEQKMLAGVKVAVDAVFDSVSVATTFKKTLAESGVIFSSFSEAVADFPELVRRYLGSVVPAGDNFYAALNAAVFSDGSFVYIPKGVRCPMELSTYFRINAMNTGQFERTLIVADEDSHVSYLEGCTAPMRDENQLHAAVVELVAMKGAQIKYSTVQNWYPGDEQGRGGIYNFVTKRGVCRGERAKISWTQVETGSAITWKYPSVLLEGDNSIGEFYSVALTNNYQQADTGTKMVHIGKNTSSTIISKGISAGHGQNAYRGLVKVIAGAENARNYSQCDSLLMGDLCGAHTFPYMEIKNPTAVVEHEATTSRIGEDQLFYCRQRGLSEEDALSMIVNGFCKEVFKELPMEFAVEAQKLLGISLEGSVG